MTNQFHCQYKTLKQNMLNLHGVKGETWIANLPMIVDELRDLWKLKNLQPVDNMSFHFVAKAETDSNQMVVLKIGLDENVIQSEMQALKFFNGHAMIKLIDYDKKHNAMLLQQAIPGDSLKSLYPEKWEYVINAYAATIKKLHQQTIGNQSFRHVREWLLSLDRVDSEKIPKNLLNKAIQLKNNLLNTSKNEIILHGDLHLDNVLQNGSDWIVIDPKGIVGEVEFEVAAFDFISSSEFAKNDLRTLFDLRIKLLAEKTHLDLQRLKDWVFVRLVLMAAWLIEDNDDPNWVINLIEKIY